MSGQVTLKLQSADFDFDSHDGLCISIEYESAWLTRQEACELLGFLKSNLEPENEQPSCPVR